jgi:ComF family protein
MRLFIDTVFQFLLPSQCYCCQKFLGQGKKGICSDCLSKIRWIGSSFCSVCGIPFASDQAGVHPCGECFKKRFPFASARSIGAYEGPLQEAIHQWKYEGRVALTGLFGKWLAEGFGRYWTPSLFDLLIPVPVHKHRLRERGFNQSLLLARELSLLTGIPYKKRVLRKIRATVPQVALSGTERKKVLKGSFLVSSREEVNRKSVLLIDDVFTTGATVRECSRVLKAAGAKRVDVLTLAHALKSL